MRHLQFKIATAYKLGKMDRVMELQRILVNSWAARMLAAKQVARSSGGKTPGVDGKIIPNTTIGVATAAQELGKVTSNPGSYKASPVLRVMIPKGPGTDELRPLGIPTAFDRAVQALYAMALLPISEVRADTGSFGFRKGLGTRDASAALKSALLSVPRPQLVFDADISKFFDTVSHDWLLANVPMNRDVLRSILTAGAIDGGNKIDTDRGFPQGGIISPMLGNFVLDGLQQVIMDSIGKYQVYLPQMRVVRYADDFVVMGPSKLWLFNNFIIPAISLFLAERGLALHPVKSKVVNPYSEGFDFLGMNYSWKANVNMPGKHWLRIVPSDKSVERFKMRVREIISNCKDLNYRMNMISQLNLLITGWGNYHIFGNVSVIFNELDKFVWDAYLNWLKGHFPKGTVASLSKIGFMQVNNTKSVPFGINEQGIKVPLKRLSTMSIRSFSIVEVKRSGFLEEFNKFNEDDRD